MAEVILRGIRKSYGSTEVIHGVDLEIRDGEFVVFVGPSGCGKSTLLRLIAGLEEITGGELLIGGEVVNDRTPRERGIAMVFQSYALYPHMNAYDNMAFGLELSKLSKGEIDKRVRDVAAKLRIGELLDRRPRDLSGGQRQRVAIGRAIVRNPKVFLFDEPLSNLDAALRVQTRIEIAALHRETGTTMIYVTHDQVEALTLAQTIVVLNAGRVEQIGPPLELYHRPANLFVAGFIGSPRMNFWTSEVQQVRPGAVTVRGPSGGGMEIKTEANALRVSDAVTVGIRPEHIGIGTGDGVSAQGRIELVEHLGESHLLYVRAGRDLILTVRASGDARHSMGQDVLLNLPVQHCYVFDKSGSAVGRGNDRPRS
jgi:multiple sugar transport system ATP-binding protein